MFHAYIDEAGIGDKEPIVVCSALLVPDEKVSEIVSYHDRIINEYEIEKHAGRAVLHMDEIYNARRNFKKLDVGRRLDLMKDILQVRVCCDLQVVLCCFQKLDFSYIEKKFDNPKISRFCHFLSSIACVGIVDKIVASENSKANIVFENLDSKFLRNKLEETVRFCVDGFPISHIHLYPSFYHLGLPFAHTGSSLTFDSKENIFLQFSDAFAFAGRRYFGKLKYGSDLFSQMHAMHEHRLPFHIELGPSTVVILPPPSRVAGDEIVSSRYFHPMSDLIEGKRTAFSGMPPSIFYGSKK